MPSNEKAICQICFGSHLLYGKDYKCPEFWSCGACGEICETKDGTILNSNGNGFYGEFVHNPELCPAQDEIKGDN